LYRRLITLTVNFVGAGDAGTQSTDAGANPLVEVQTPPVAVRPNTKLPIGRLGLVADHDIEAVKLKFQRLRKRLTAATGTAKPAG